MPSDRLFLNAFNAPAPKLPVFSEGSNTDPADIEGLFSLLEQLAEIHGRGKEWCAFMLPFQLRGGALRTHRNLPNNKDWDAVKMQMMAQYGPTKLPISVSYPLLTSIQQTERMGVNDYYQSMIRAAEKFGYF